MKLPGWLKPQIRKLSSTTHEAPQALLHVINSSRNTILANRLELADKGTARRKGLLGRKGLNPGQGLWIRPCESVHTFAMQFAIDLVYLDRRMRVRKLRSSVAPWRISTCLTAHSVLELPSGTIAATQTQRGDILDFSIANPSA